MANEELAFDAAKRICEDLFSDRVLLSAERNVWPARHWITFEEFGIPRALVSEVQGGAGLTKQEAIGLVRLGGLFAIPMPLWETMLANWLLAKGNVACERGATTIAPINPHELLTVSRSSRQWRLRGIAHRVPWGADAGLVAVAKEDTGDRWHVMRLNPASANAERGVSIAGEPRDTLVLDLEVPRQSIGELPATWNHMTLLLAGAAIRTVAIAGALQRVLEITVRYANERVQFGRPIGRFQAVQQSVARLAGEVAAANTAADLAIQAFDEPSSFDCIAVAKTRAGEAAGIGAAIAHQVHGAIGFTKEYRLNFFTRRLWAWRDEFGTEAFWSAYIGRMAAAAGGDDLWPTIVRL